MKFSLSWLKEYIDIDMSIEELVEQLDMSGTAVEGVTYLGKGLEKVVVGQILKVEKHPNADKLTLCQVDVGEKELTIVCGAPNVSDGQKVLVALVGAELPNGAKITKAKIRGVKSKGMICSETELGLGDDASGIIVLPDDANVGQASVEYLGRDDYQLELEITPNRPDCLGILGIAREVSTLTGKKICWPKVDLEEDNESASDSATITIEDDDLCPRYVGRVVKGVKIGPSPQWMQSRLKNAGVRPINNIVDITNYVMLESSQPLHAFDLNKLSDSSIIVRRAKQGETIISLDGIERQLSTDNLLICDKQGPVAIAGVMGGEDSEVSPKTIDILIESAHFKPESVMNTSRNLGLITEASYRFEKGIDPNGCLWAADRATQMVAEIAGGRILKGAIDVFPNKIEPKKLDYRIDKCNKFLGTAIKKKEQISILESLGMKISSAKDRKLKVVVPTYRPDLEREVDLFEEVARIFGYSRIESTLPISRKRRGKLTEYQQLKRKLRHILISSGLNEILSYSFLKEGWEDKLKLGIDNDLRNTVKITNPLADDQAELRSSLLPGLLKAAQYNINRDMANVQIFEIGRVFFSRAEGLPAEKEIAAAILSGEWTDKSWYGKYPDIDFFDAKGIIENLLNIIGVKNYEFKQQSGKRQSIKVEKQIEADASSKKKNDAYRFLHPGISADLKVGHVTIGIVGEIHPQVLHNYQIEQRVIYFELYLKTLAENISTEKSFSQFSPYPGIVHDIAIVVNEEYTAKKVIGVIRQIKSDILKDIRLFDIYSGSQVPEGKKSLAFRLLFQSGERTLTEDEAKETRDEVIALLEEKIGAKIRT